jgi:hypothetical protein
MILRDIMKQREESRMSSKWRYILGTTTMLVIVGGTIYAIKKSKDLEKSEEESISLAEARALVKERGGKTEVTAEFTQVTEGVDTGIDESHRIIGSSGVKPPLSEVVKEVEKARIIKATAVSDMDSDENEEDLLDEDDPLHDAYPELTEDSDNLPISDWEGEDIPSVEPLTDFYYYEEGINPKEDKTLRYDPNSIDAKHQFIRMELADWQPDNDVYRILLQLFEFTFVPRNRGDEILRTQIMDYKVQFFGYNSKWNKEISFADVILHYARAAEFNCGESIPYWVEYFLEFNEIEWDSTSQHIDMILDRLNTHSYFNEERQTFGLFGLTRESMDNAIKIANRNVDRSVTYEIEFNEFLKSCI